MKHYPAILAAIYNTPHCILPEKLQEIAAFAEAVADGKPLTPVEIEGPLQRCYAVADGELASSDRFSAAAAGDAFVAVLPLFGTMHQHGSLEMRYSGGMSTESFGRQFAALDANPAVKTIVIETHSPGGQVFGTQELGDLIFGARQRDETRIVAAVNSMAASAALWACTAAHEVVVTPGGAMGSVGVCYAHVDVSGAEKKAGLKTTLLATPEKKIAGNEFEPLADDVRAEILGRQEKTLGRFVAALARHRGVDEQHVRTKFGGGDMLRADEAVAAGMADRIAPLREVMAAEIERLRTRGAGNSRANARALDLAEADE